MNFGRKFIEFEKQVHDFLENFTKIEKQFMDF